MTRFSKLFGPCLLCFWLFWSSAAIAQVQELPSLSDSLKMAFAAPKKITGFLETRNSFLDGKSAQIRGAKVGVKFGDKIIMGIGYHWLQKGFSEQISSQDLEAAGNVRLQFLAPFISYTFHTRDKWSFALPVQIGIGQSSLVINREDGTRAVFNKGRQVLYEPAMVVRYAVTDYLRVGGGLGYRIVLKRNRALATNFTSLVYMIKMELNFGHLWSVLRPTDSE